MSVSAILVASGQGPELQKTIKARVNREFLTVDLCHNFAQLFAQLSGRSYALLVIDLAILAKAFPSGSFFKRLKAVSSNTAVMVLAHLDEREQAVDYLQQGATDYLLFPVNPTELSLKINRILDSAGDELLMLREASREISHTLQLDEALKIVLSKANHITQADLAEVFLADQSGNLSQSKPVIQTLPPIGTSGEIDHLFFGLAQEAAFSREIVHRQRPSSPAWQNQAIQSVLLIPMVSRDKLIGVLVLGSQQPSAFLADQIRWLSIFCDQAAIAIENARLFQDLSSAYIDLAQSREEILRSRNTLQVLFDGIADGLYILDQELTINALNQVEAERQGYQPEALVGKSYLSLPWTRAAPELLNRINESLQTGRETTWISPENETEPYLKDREFRIYPIRNRLAHIEQVIVFAQDVSERRRWQATLFRSANLAAVGQLAGSIAHQINNPLTVAIANSQLLSVEANPESETYELATGIFKAAERIEKIIENLLEFSNQETYCFVETDLIDTIEGALALVIRSLKKVNIEVVKDYRVRPRLSASVSHLKLVWMNLLLNARDAVVDFAEKPQIKISTGAVSEREIKVAITDNGAGIAEKDLEQLFRPFFTTKQVDRALGLGLYSAHAIIERHNGQIKVFSEPGVATTFEVILPLDNPRDL